MKKETKRTIWTSFINYEDWKEDLEDCYPDEDGYTDEDRQEIAYNTNMDYYFDEQINLDIDLNQPIIIIANLGLWNGRRSGYKEIKGNIKNCLTDVVDDENEWYVDERGDLRGTGWHHDGTNHYLYRVWKDTASEQQKENLLRKIYNGDFSRKDITRLTKRLGDEIASVYGWKL